VNEDLIRRLVEAGAEIEERVRGQAQAMIDALPKGTPAGEIVTALAYALGVSGQILQDEGCPGQVVELISQQALYAGQLAVQDARPKKKRRKKKENLSAADALRAVEDLLRKDGS
jgi:hypothetical protein